MRTFIIMATLGAAIFAAPPSPDTFRNVSTTIRAYGYPAEEHFLVTRDGFILQAERIPHGINSTSGGGPPVFLMPGLTCSTSVFVGMLPPHGLPYMLADAGYDVWLINQRGRPVPRHVTFQPTDFGMWDWSFDEIAQYDVLAGLDYIRNVTGHANTAAFMGHSQGGSVGLIAFSEYPELMGRVGLNVVLAGPFGPPPKAPKEEAPVATRSRRSFACPDIPTWPGACAGLLGLHDGWNITWEACNELPATCEEAMCFIVGCGSNHSSPADRITAFLGHYPTYTSLKNSQHWDQSGGGFRKFDYGEVGNFEHYGTATPPIYNVSNLGTRSILFFGSQDKFCPYNSVKNILPLLPASQVALVSELDYGHLDFLLASDAPTQIYAKILSFLPAPSGS